MSVKIFLTVLMEQERNTIVSIYCRGGEERQLAYSSFFFIVHYSSDLMA